jgi:hypothetical protein
MKLIACLIIYIQLLHANVLRNPFFSANANQKRFRRLLHSVILTNGGSTEQIDGGVNNDKPEETCTVIVSTAIGSSFLDKKKKMIISKNSTVIELKNQLYKKFPGSPPVKIQKLIFGLNKLDDHQIIGNLTAISPIPLLLDIISGTSAYNKTMTISQALEAHSSLTVHQAYLGNQLQELFRNQIVNNPNNTNVDLTSPIVETAIYKDMLHMLNDTLYSTYSDDIINALEEEKEPEVNYNIIV